jgi:uncharacterized membrane protein YgaE (UPF0421/DUF939 family)
MSRYMTAYEFEKLKARNNRVAGFVIGVILTSVIFYFIGGC